MDDDVACWHREGVSEIEIVVGLDFLTGVI